MMKFLLGVVLIPLTLIFFIVGCTHTEHTTAQNADGTVSVTTTVVQGIDPAVKAAAIKALKEAAAIGSSNGLKVWYKNHPDSATECATLLKQNLSQEVLPWLNGGTLQYGPEITTLLSAHMFAKLNPDFVDIIDLGTDVLDIYLNGPNAANLTGQDKIDYVTAFVQGVNDGCDEFLANPKAPLRKRGK